MPAIDALFDSLLAAGGSDLHLSVGYPPMMRAKGELVPIAGRPVLTNHELEATLHEILKPHERKQYDNEHDLDFAYGFGTRARFRGNYFVKTTGVAAVFRTIPTKILTLDQLKVPTTIRTLAEKRAGLVMVTGPTGSGKSTTLAGMIDHINKTRAAHILTVEDPVEFVHQPQKCQITHREVGRDVPSFADAIRSAGREDPDVVLIGELRGAETMGLALQMASSGVLVFATIHTNSAAATIDRFVNAFPSGQQPAVRGMLAECLTGIVSQQLLKRADGSGRVAAHEILVGNRAIGSCIRESKTSMITSLLQSGKADGMQTMDSTLETLMKNKEIGPEDALGKAIDKESFKNLPMVVEALKAKAEAGGEIHE